MYILKVNKGRVEVLETNGRFVRAFGDKVISADISNDQTLVLLTTTIGRVELRKIDGYFVKKIGNINATNAKWVGDDIAITTNIGRVELWSIKDRFLRVL